VITPGGASDQSAYRSELAGILAAISVINALAKFHHISTNITIHCDCQKGLDKAFNLSSTPNLNDASHDFLQAIQYEIKNTSIGWQGSHIKGHQDVQFSFEQLDRISQLNIQVDRMAKEFVKTAIILPRHFDVTTPAWKIKLHNFTIIANIDQTLYELVHTAPSRDYWIKKNRISESAFDSINWSRLRQALANMPLTCRLFCTKHTIGMCGVGKFQKLWKMRETDSCPHCGHIWTCGSPAVNEVWTQSLLKLESALKKLDTDPQLLETIIAYLTSWQLDDTLRPLGSVEYRLMTDKQNTIGQRQFFEGWHHTDWELVQERYYQNL
jgi:hypothetical protein